MQKNVDTDGIMDMASQMRLMEQELDTLESLLNGALNNLDMEILSTGMIKRAITQLKNRVKNQRTKLGTYQLTLQETASDYSSALDKSDGNAKKLGYLNDLSYRLDTSGSWETRVTTNMASQMAGITSLSGMICAGPSIFKNMSGLSTSTPLVLVSDANKELSLPSKLEESLKWGLGTSASKETGMYFDPSMKQEPGICFDPSIKQKPGIYFDPTLKSGSGSVCENRYSLSQDSGLYCEEKENKGGFYYISNAVESFVKWGADVSTVVGGDFSSAGDVINGMFNMGQDVTAVLAYGLGKVFDNEEYGAEMAEDYANRNGLSGELRASGWEQTADYIDAAADPVNKVKDTYKLAKSIKSVDKFLADRKYSMKDAQELFGFDSTKDMNRTELFWGLISNVDAGNNIGNKLLEAETPDEGMEALFSEGVIGEYYARYQKFMEN